MAVFAILKALSDPSYLVNLLLRLLGDLAKEAGAEALARIWEQQPPATRMILRSLVKRSETTWDDALLAQIDQEFDDESADAVMGAGSSS